MVTSSHSRSKIWGPCRFVLSRGRHKWKFSRYPSVPKIFFPAGTHRYPKFFFLAGTRYPSVPKIFFRYTAVPKFAKFRWVPAGTHGYRGTASADPRFRALSSRLKCICVHFQNSVFSRKITWRCVNAKRCYKKLNLNVISITNCVRISLISLVRPNRSE